MKVIVLGTGQDAGIPQIGCRCKNCEAARKDPSRRRTGSSLALVDSTSSRVYLIDASIHLTDQVDRLMHTHVKAGLEVLEDIFITHAHMGHIHGLGLLGKEAADVRAVKVYAGKAVLGFLRKNLIYKRLVNRGNMQLREIQEGEELDFFDDALIMPFVVPHRADGVLTFGFRITQKEHSIVYIPDMDTLTRDIKKIVKDSEIAILDGTFFDLNELPGRDMSEISHPLMEDTIRTLGEMDTRIIFTHINHSNPVSDPASKEYQHVIEAGHEIAFEGQVLSLGP